MGEHFPDATKKVDFIRRDKVHVQIERALCEGLPYHRTIDEIPAVDVVEVVRCKDCTYFNHVKCQEERAGLCEHFDTYMYISDYCSDGYRRDDNG